MTESVPSETSFESQALDRLERLGGTKLVRRMVELFVRAAGERVDRLRTGSGASPSEVRMVASLKTTVGLICREFDRAAARVVRLAAQR